MLLLVDLLGAHVLKNLSRFLRWRAGAAVGFDPLAILLKALRKVLEALSGYALLTLWGDREV